MKVLHLFASPYWSGPAENIALLAAAQREIGHEATVAIDLKRRVAPAEELALPHFLKSGLLGNLGLELSVKSTPFAIWRDLSILRRCDADVIHSHFSHDHYLAAWSRRGRPVLVRSIHSPRRRRWSIPDGDGFTVFNDRETRYFTKRPTIVLPALVGPEYVKSENKTLLRQKLGLSGQPVIGMASTFKESRRHTLGLQAFDVLRRSLASAQMLLMGDGEKLSSAKSEAARLRLDDAVIFTGYVSSAEFVERLQAVDVLWVLGLGNDWSGRIAAQAKACGAAVVGIADGALPNLADVLVSDLIPEAVAAATKGITVRERVRRSNLQIASDVINFYVQIQKQRREGTLGRDSFLPGLH